jgi:beta-aspartyl-peptidase (threonine type)
MEDNPVFNAGYGAALNADGKVRMDAGLMDGKNRESGAVGAIDGVRHPISVARKVLEQQPVLIVGPYARQFAGQQGAELCAPDALITTEQCEKWEDEHKGRQEVQNNTVGAVAFDAAGNLACGVSTGGTGNNIPGRVGDSATVGAGFYAENAAGASAMTGDGETIMRAALSKRVTELLGRDHLPADAAARKAIELLQEYVQGEAGCILLDSAGNVGWAHNSEHLACAYMTSAMAAPAVHLAKEEEQREQAHA